MLENCFAISVKCYIIENRATKLDMPTVQYSCMSLYLLYYAVYTHISSNPVLINGPHDT